MKFNILSQNFYLKKYVYISNYFLYITILLRAKQILFPFKWNHQICGTKVDIETFDTLLNSENFCVNIVDYVIKQVNIIM